MLVNFFYFVFTFVQNVGKMCILGMKSEMLSKNIWAFLLQFWAGCTKILEKFDFCLSGVRAKNLMATLPPRKFSALLWNPPLNIKDMPDIEICRIVDCLKTFQKVLKHFQDLETFQVVWKLFRWSDNYGLETWKLVGQLFSILCLKS